MTGSKRLLIFDNDEIVQYWAWLNNGIIWAIFISSGEYTSFERFVDLLMEWIKMPSYF